MYKAAVIINRLLLGGSFILCFNIMRKLIDHIEEYYLMALSFITSMLPIYFVYVNIAWCESLWSFVVLLIIWLFIKLDDKISDIKFILIGFFSVYAFMIHQCSIGILLASIVIISAMKLTNKYAGKVSFSFQCRASSVSKSVYQSTVLYSCLKLSFILFRIF